LEFLIFAFNQLQPLGKFSIHIKKKYARSVILFAMALFAASCSSTKFVPEDKYLLRNVKVKCDERKIDIKEMKTYLRQTHNTKILGFWKFHLGVYNLSKKDKERGWLKRIGEPPVVYDEFLTGKSLEQLELFLKSKGYYNAVVSDTVKLKKRKAELVFRVHAGTPYRINRIHYDVRDSVLERMILTRKKRSLIKSGALFDLDLLEEERKRIVQNVRNRGFYNFSKNVIFYEADTFGLNKQVDLNVVVGLRGSDKSLVEVSNHKKFYLNNFYVFTDFDPKKALSDPDQYFGSFDTLNMEPYSFIYRDKIKVKPEVLRSANHIDDSLFFRVNGVERTYKSLNKLKNYKYINIQFQDGGERDSLSRWLNCYMQLSPAIPQSYSIEVEGTNSSGNFGFATNLNYQHKNIFGGAEIFDLRLKGAMERLRLVDDNQNFNTLEGGIDLKLTFPKFLAAQKIQRFFKYDVPGTNLNLSYNYQKRPDYTRTISSFRYGYFWESSKYLKHFFNPIDLNVVRIFKKDDDFINSIEDLYIRASYTDHVIPSMNYSMIYTTQELDKRKDYSFFRWNAEVAGNLVNEISKLTNRRSHSVVDTIAGTTSEYYKLFGSRYAQYIKSDLELRHGWVIDRANTFVARLFAGVGVPYGNWDLMPFEKQYFTGGANGVRAWLVRSLGPGSYSAPVDAYPNQLGDIKMEANLEYRFKMFWILEGALFLDAGNIWSISGKDNREGAVFKWGKFYNEFAVGTGLGTRFDFKYVIFRLDLGLKLRDPSLTSGNRWIPSNRSFNRNDIVWSFAIGYPF